MLEGGAELRFEHLAVRDVGSVRGGHGSSTGSFSVQSKRLVVRIL
jgi:hypothetical protein